MFSMQILRLKIALFTIESRKNVETNLVPLKESYKSAC